MTGERCEKRPSEQAIRPDPEIPVASSDSDVDHGSGPDARPGAHPDARPSPSSREPADAVSPPSTGFPPSPGTLDRALTVVRYLREHCEWDRRQTARSLVRHLLEEAAETAEAIESGDADHLRDELGDLLLNLAFQVVVAEEAGRFSAEAVIAALETKMIRRHPHLFGLGERESWEAIKARENEGRRPPPQGPTATGTRVIEAPAPGDPPPASAGLASGAPPPRGEPSRGEPARAGSSEPLTSALQVQVRAAAVGFDWEAVGGALDKTREELEEVREALDQGEGSGIREEIGDLLFSVVNVARLAGVDPGDALTAATGKFTRRFAGVEALARARGIALPDSSLEALDALWNEVKKDG
jgi:nucleoside triphosphate diphosphatase